jgi:hypothetical protein
MNAKVRYPAVEMLLPKSRWVRGSLTEKTTTDHKNQPMEERKHHYWIALAMPKSNPATSEVVNKIMAHAWQTYQGVAGSGGVIAQMQQGLAATAFAWRLHDGDTDPKWKGRPGCAGSFIIEMKSGFDIPCFDGANRQLDPKAFKLGDWVDAYVSIEINGEVGNTAGVFVNPRGLRWLEEGERIQLSADPNAMFGAPVNAGYSGHTHQPPAGSQMMGNGNPAPAIQPMVTSPATIAATGVPSVGTAAQPGHYNQQAQAAPAYPQPGMAGAAPGMQPPAPPPVHETAEQVAARFGVQHHPGWRWNPQTGQYVPDAPPPPPPPPVAPAAAPAAQAGGYPTPGVPSVAPGGQMGTASHGSPYGPGNPPPGIQPATGFAAGQPPRIG